MKTISQIAREIGVSKQAVYKKIRSKPLSTNLSTNLSTVDNKLTVDVDGESMIKSAFLKKSVSTSLHEQSTACQPVDGLVDTKIINLLQENISVLQKQLEIKDKQIEELTATIKIQAESINAANKNELAETIIDGGLLDGGRLEKRNIFFRIFRKSDK